MEFEADVNMNKTGISYKMYIDILRYIQHVNAAKKLKITESTALDINYSDTVGDIRTNYRITIDDLATINKYMNKLQTRKNHVIFNVMANAVKTSGSESHVIMYSKSKQEGDMFDIPNLNTRFRLASEDPMHTAEIDKLGLLDEHSRNKIMFRYKQRVSLILHDSADCIIHIDLTTVKMSNDISKIDYGHPIYELEVEYSPKKTADMSNYLDIFLSEITTILKVLQQSNYIITKDTQQQVLEEYRRMLSVSSNAVKLNGRQPISLEIGHAVDVLPNKYAAMDKADGDRHFMIICFKHVFLISSNLDVKDTGIQLMNEQYNNTIFDCEYVFLPKHNRYLILPFDCLIVNNEDIRKNPVFTDRMHLAEKVIREAFVFGKQKGFVPKPFTGTNDAENWAKYYSDTLDAHLAALLHDIEHEKQVPLVRPKCIFPVHGISNNEIFLYSTIIWNKYVSHTNPTYPYSLDGIIYQPLNQMYITIKKDIQSFDYKWKPPEMNTIDFFVRFERDTVTKKIVNVYDNSDAKVSSDKPYRICYLHNGKQTPAGEHPVLFNEALGLHIAHLFIENGEVRDAHGDIINDSTVVEFSYNNSLALGDKYRWLPLRTRYDKTEMVQKHGIQHGNAYDMALRIWNSITYPVLASDLVSLANLATYSKHSNEMRKRITTAMDQAEIASPDAGYYQKQQKNVAAKPMESFHNFIKSILIFAYFGQDYNKRKIRVLDMACGRGGDLFKLYHAEVGSGVCFDIDYVTLNAINGPKDRYRGFKKTYPGFPPFEFLCCDFRTPLDADSQYQVIADKSDTNKDLIAKIFPSKDMKQFDGINMQFALHYGLENEATWKNVCGNINKCLKPGGVMIITTFDAHRVITALGTQTNYATHYTMDGNKKILMDIVRKFPITQTSGLGMAIDVYNSMLSNENVYFTEYLIEKDFLINEFKTKCDMRLLDTDTFDIVYELQRDMITKISQTDTNLKTRKFIGDVAQFYNQTLPDHAECFKVSRLNRYYVFQKEDK
jgi:SAM-dependent methyltransferase